MKKGKKIIRDPIYGLIIFEKDTESSILDIVDSPEFQRLRRIKQLGFSSYTFPTATHDRFSHSIGVSFVLGKILDSLNLPKEIAIPTVGVNGTTSRVSISKEELKLLLRLAGLLHDIGHGPFSHAFEKITLVNHETITKEIINSSSIADILCSIKSSPILKRNAKKWITDIINGTFQPVWIKELISSQLDADRIDYLLRDAYMCGVSYASFDTKWLFRHLEIGRINSEHGREGLVINAKKGIHAIESFIISRYHMYEQVYFHKTTRCFEIIAQKIFQRLLELQKGGNPLDGYFLGDAFFGFFNHSGNWLKNFLALDDYMIMAHIIHWQTYTNDKILKGLCSGLVNRRPFKMLKEVEADYKEISDIRDRAKERLSREEFEYGFFVDDYKNMPYKDTYLLGIKGPESAEHIWLKFNGQQKELAEASPIIRSLKNRELKRYRAYIRRDLIEKIGG